MSSAARVFMNTELRSPAAAPYGQCCLGGPDPRVRRQRTGKLRRPPRGALAGPGGAQTCRVTVGAQGVITEVYVRRHHQPLPNADQSLKFHFTDAAGADQDITGKTVT